MTAPETILDATLEIVDPHHHIWNRGGHRYLADELRADLDSGHNVTATAYVECRNAWSDSGLESLRPSGETAFVVGELDGQRAGAAIIAYADLSLGSQVEAVLDAHEAVGEGRLRAVRYATAWHEGGAIRSHYPTRAGMLCEPAVKAGIAALGRRGLAFDVWSYFNQLSDVVAALDACPGTQFVLDHCGGPIGIGPWQGRRIEVLAQWRPAIREIARRHNVVVKLGGLGMPLAGFAFHKGAVLPSSADLAVAWSPYILHCIESFGPERCMFESNWPVDATAGSYAVVWNAFKRIAARYSDEERAQMFAGTARRIYRIG